MILSSLTQGQKLGLLAALNLIAVGTLLLLAWKRRKVAAMLKRWEGADFWLAVAEGMSAFTAGAVAAACKIWDPQMWTQHPIQTELALCISAGLTFCVVLAKWARDRVKERDKERVNELNHQLEIETVRLKRFRRLGTQIRGLIQRKIERVREVAKKPDPTVDDLIITTARQTQVHTIITSILEFFSFELESLKPEGRMRIGLYIPDKERTELRHAYSFDGQKKNCFQDNSEWMKLNSPKGIRSEIVRAYHADGDQKLQLIPDCSKHPNFTFFRPEQRDYLKSMLTFKYLLQLDGAQSALMLCIDCDEPDFFSKDRYEEISEFLVEMLKRFEYEMLGLEIVAKIRKTP